MGNDLQKLQETALVEVQQATSKIDLEGFSDGTCAKVMNDFRGGDRVLREQKKPAFYNRPTDAPEQQQQH